MVRKVGLFFLYLFFFVMALMYFAPKTSIYYFLEEQLKEYAVIVSFEELEDSGFTLNIKDASISMKSVDSANIRSTNIKIFGLYNAVDFKDIALSSAAKSFLPLNIERVNIRYTIFDPLNVHAQAKGEFGEVDAKLSIVEKSLKATVVPSAVMLKSYKKSLKNLTKNENGEYVYDKNF